MYIKGEKEGERVKWIDDLSLLHRGKDLPRTTGGTGRTGSVVKECRLTLMVLRWVGTEFV